MLERSIDRVTRIPALGPGFDGERHKAALVIAPGELAGTDPFFLMADDNITLGGRFGEARLHAGLETVTFMLNGTMEDTGVPPRVYLTRLRMEKACELLKLTDLPITEIAFEVGYSSNQVFARVLLKHKRMSPTDYRRATRDPVRQMSTH